MGLFQKQTTLPVLRRDLFKLEKNAIIPELKDLSNEAFTYQILGKLITIKITKQFYSLEEPELNNNEKQIYDIIKKSLYEIINIDTNEKIEEYIEKSIRVIISELNMEISEELMQKLIYYSYRDFIGLGKIEAMLRDPLVSEILFSNEILSINHKRYGKISTNIMLNEEDILSILRKLAIKCNTELSPIEPEKQIKGELNIGYFYNPEQPLQSRFFLHKNFKNYPSPLDLLKEKKLSPEILAFLWLLIDNQHNIFIIKDTNLLHSLSYFLPPHTKILTNLKDYYPNIHTTTFFGENACGEDFALIDNYNNQTYSNIIITSIANVAPEGRILVMTDNGIVTSIKESNTELFLYKEGKFLFNLNNSAFINSKGNPAIMIEELKLRTKLLNVLSKVNLKDDDLKRIIYIYHENPVAVLRKAGVL